MNNWLIFLKTKKKYTKHVLIILKRFKRLELNIDILKLKFYIQKVKFLKLIITLHKIKMDSKKIKLIKN